MTIEILTPPTRAEWLALRKQTIGASEAPSLVGCGHKSPAALWAAKSGLVEEDEPETAQMKRGRHIEPVGVSMMQEEYPDWTVTANIIGQGGKIYRDLDLGLHATPDVFVGDKMRYGYGAVNIKSVGVYAFKNSWQHDDGTVSVPNYIAVQIVQEAKLTGASWAACAAIIVADAGIVLHILEVPIHEGIWNRICVEAKDFWRSVREGTLPDFDYAQDGALIDRLYAGETGEIIDLSGSNDIPELVAEDQTLRARIKVDQGRRDEIKNRFKDELKEAASAIYNGRVIATRKIIHKKGFAVQPSQYTQITLKPEQAEHP